MRNLSCENEFYSQVHSNANHTHFHMKDFALGLVLKQRQKRTRKWPINVLCSYRKETGTGLCQILEKAHHHSEKQKKNKKIKNLDLHIRT